MIDPIVIIVWMFIVAGLMALALLIVVVGLSIKEWCNARRRKCNIH